MMSSLTRRFPRQPSPRTGAFLAIIAAGTALVFVIGYTAGRGYGRRLLQILWDGDREARAKARQLGNVVGARDYIDQVSTEVEGLEKLVEETAQSVGREAAQTQHAERGKRLGKSVTDVLLHLDKVTGDDQVRVARRKQVERALALGKRIADAVGEKVSRL